MSKPQRPTLAEIRSKWPATVAITKAAVAIGCSSSYLYDQIRKGASPVKTIPVGKRRVVVTADLVRLLSGEERAA
ncbi:DNA-binding protein [Streptomyces coffeae]|uniref:DNA-binding protein n=1 Tax=Streptomyces coffeae TaxID=621382 RepID=A0ABS1NFT2_9ACTN|nr:DNA-binding protein [Streptomyces coffeae]MBL1098916.1 DNA-binding protein [Streptomyces coffeae]